MSEARRAESNGADDRDRTGDLVLTKDALCQLSYIGLRLRLLPTGFARSASSAMLSVPLTLTAARHSRAHRRGAGRRGPRERRRRGVRGAKPLGVNLERETGIEPATNSLEGCDSTTELLPPGFLASGGFGPRPPTRVLARRFRRLAPIARLTRFARSISLPRFRSALRRSLQRISRSGARPPGRASDGVGAEGRSPSDENGGEGRIRTFEAAGATDLQSAAFDRFATSPNLRPPRALFPDWPRGVTPLARGASRAGAYTRGRLGMACERAPPCLPANCLDLRVRLPLRTAGPKSHVLNPPSRSRAPADNLELAKGFEPPTG